MGTYPWEHSVVPTPNPGRFQPGFVAHRAWFDGKKRNSVLLRRRRGASTDPTHCSTSIMPREAPFHICSPDAKLRSADSTGPCSSPPADRCPSIAVLPPDPAWSTQRTPRSPPCHRGANRLAQNLHARRGNGPRREGKAMREGNGKWGGGRRRRHFNNSRSTPKQNWT